MKKIFTLLVMVVLAACWTSCSDDDDNNKDEDTSKDKKLVSKIECTTSDNDDYHIIWEYSYNNDQTIQKITHKLTEDGEVYIQTNTLEHSTDKLIIHVNDSNPEGEEQYVITCTLNNQNNITDIKADIDCASNNAKFVYSDDNHLILNTIEYDEEFTWDNNGNLVNIDKYGTIRCTMSEVENKANIDFNQILLNYPNTDGDFDVTALTGYIGEKSKNLILKGSDWTDIESHEYIVDKEGYPTEIKGMTSSNKIYCVYKITYTE